MTRTRRRPPWLVVAVAAVTVAFFALPLVGLIDRASWSTLGHDLT
jgi:molybdate transport system permease protein